MAVWHHIAPARVWRYRQCRAPTKKSRHDISSTINKRQHRRKYQCRNVRRREASEWRVSTIFKTADGGWYGENAPRRRPFAVYCRRGIILHQCSSARARPAMVYGVVNGNGLNVHRLDTHELKIWAAW